MKKKGRISGTIGLIISLALAGSTVVYGTMFHKSTVGQAVGVVGGTTGNVIGAWTKRDDGFKETKKLLDDAVTLFTGTFDENEESEEEHYKNYTLSFTINTTSTTGKTVTYSTTEGYVCADESYTYLKLTVRTPQYETATAEDGTETQEYSYTLSTTEYVYDKTGDTPVLYIRTLAEDEAILPGTVADATWVDTTTWTVADASGAESYLEVLAYLGGVSIAFDEADLLLETEDNPLKTELTGEISFASTSTVELLNTKYTLNETCLFTLGRLPNIYYEVYEAPETTTTEENTEETTEDDATATVDDTTSRTSISLNFSNLNNTKVNVSLGASEDTTGGNE